MTATAVFLAVVASVVGWWLSQQRLAAKTWLEEGLLADPRVSGVPAWPAAQVGLGVFLGVAGALFALLISAYTMRVTGARPSAPQWVPASVQRLLWLNTAVLALCSAALEWARAAARRGRLSEARDGLLAGGACALAFLAGQLMAWRRLAAAGEVMVLGPATAFFFLISGLHGLHVLGGLVALGRTTARAFGGPVPDGLVLSVRLCSAYWHFLLLVWLVVLAALSGWASGVLAICRAVSP